MKGEKEFSMVIDFEAARARRAHSNENEKNLWADWSFSLLIQRMDEQMLIVGGGNIGALRQYYLQCCYATQFVLNYKNDERIRELRRKLDAGGGMLCVMSAKAADPDIEYILRRMAGRLYTLQERTYDAPPS